MILVRSKLKISKIHGIGLFAEEAIKQGQPVWKFNDTFDLVLSKDQVELLSEAAKEQFFNYAYISKRTHKYILCSDDSRFFNHQDNSNTVCFVPENDTHDESLICIATRNIKIGEELTNNYAEFDHDPSDVIK